MDLKRGIEAGVPGAEVDGRVGRSGCFEVGGGCPWLLIRALAQPRRQVTVDGKLVFSKLKTGGFPNQEALVKALRCGRDGRGALARPVFLADARICSEGNAETVEIPAEKSMCAVM